ncbi:MAG: TetR/AcrR family transcriptional regulator [Thermotogota bacterium]|nr:TetR/AcrR family transcriptional regulator [Thermotogota bacterium]
MDKRSEIRRCGKAPFIEKGYKNTNIADIMKLANLGTGTFYNYYSSKDALFMEIYLEENLKLKKEIIRATDMEAEPLNVIKQMLMLNLQGMSDHPILKEWYNREVFAKIEQNFRKRNGMEGMDFLYDTFLDVVRKWQTEGKMRKDIDADMIMALFTAIITVETHKEEIGFHYFPQLVEHLLEFVMKGLSVGK